MGTNSNLPYVVALCPTFRHPQLLANSVALWLFQDYPIDRRALLILDDDPTFNSQVGYSWEIEALKSRLPTISHKYNLLLELSKKFDPDIYCVWEDDDLYMPEYVSSHVEVLHGKDNLFSKSDIVATDYPGKLIVEGSRGRFHSSLAFRRSLIEEVGGWPDTKRADFDQQLMSSLYSKAGSRVGRPWDDNTKLEEIPFIYRWHSGAAHCQSTMDKGPEDETWYDRGDDAYKKVPFVGILEPKLDDYTLSVFNRFRGAGDKLKALLASKGYLQSDITGVTPKYTK